MDWIRRNWPDLLIGIALLLVIAGIIATLLSGGSFLPFARNNSNPVTGPTVPTATSTNTPDITSTTNVGETTIGDTTVQPDTLETPAVTTEASSSQESSSETIVDAVIPDLPALGNDNATQTTSEAAITEVVPDATTATSTATTTEATTTSEASSAAANNNATSTSPASSEASYRVGVGAFGSAENAERRATTFRDAGYPVFLGQQGNLSLVLVGPYNNKAEAEAAQADIRSSGLEPNATVYEFTADTESPSNATSTATTTAPVATETAATTSAPAVTETSVATSSANFTPPPTAQSGRYLQVGAYNNIESSMPQRQRLEAYGFTVQYIEESNLIKLLVGPYDGNNLSVAESQLTAQGIESFVR